MRTPKGWLYKRSGGRKFTADKSFIPMWNKRWFVLKDSFIAYFKSPYEKVPRSVMLLDGKFSVQGTYGSNTFVFGALFAHCVPVLRSRCGAAQPTRSGS